MQLLPHVEEGNDIKMNGNGRCRFRVRYIYIYRVLRVIGSGIRYNRSGTGIRTN